MRSQSSSAQAKTHYDLGIRHLKERKYEEAISSFNKVYPGRLICANHLLGYQSWG